MNCCSDIPRKVFAECAPGPPGTYLPHERKVTPPNPATLHIYSKKKDKVSSTKKGCSCKAIAKRHKRNKNKKKHRK